MYMHFFAQQLFHIHYSTSCRLDKHATGTLSPILNYKNGFFVCVFLHYYCLQCFLSLVTVVQSPAQITPLGNQATSPRRNGPPETTGSSKDKSITAHDASTYDMN